jgi:hypothetical protein
VREAEIEKRKYAADQLLVHCGVNKIMAGQQKQWRHTFSAGLRGTSPSEGSDAERREGDGNGDKTGGFRDSGRKRANCHLCSSKE